MIGRFAVKRLVPVEIDPDRSHQHEFHAGRLRLGLGFGDEPVRGKLRLLVYRDDRSEPSVVADDFTLYDARASNPRRSEWHLYYRSRSFTQLARAADLLVLYRPSDAPDLHGVVVAPDTGRAGRLLDALMLRDDSILREFRLADEPEPGPATRALGQALSLPLDAQRSAAAAAYPIRQHPLVARAIAEERVPLTRTMAQAAAEVLSSEAARIDPDRYLADALETETSLYFTIEDALNRRKLETLQRHDAPLSAYLEWAMAIHQARRSRRGQSLQLHFATVLDAAGIPYTAQCTTEPGETPDFVIPSCRMYHDPDYPTGSLRMVACKSTSKERWRQVLNEAERIPDKYLLTLDERLTGRTIHQMRAAYLYPFLPATLLETAYAKLKERPLLGSVAQLLQRLREATVRDA